MATASTPLGHTSRFVGNFRFVFMPLGLLALLAVGIHAAADLVDDSLLRLIDQLDVWLDAVWAQSPRTQQWVDAVGSAQRTVIARGLTLTWELVVDAFIALPMLGYREADEAQPKFGARRDTWRDVLRRVVRQPTPLKVLRPMITLTFGLAGAYSVSKLVESSLFVGLQGDVTSVAVAQLLARMAGAVAMILTVASGSWRAALKALHSADAATLAAQKTGTSVWALGLWGTALSLPMAVAWLLDIRTLLSLVL